MLRVSQLNIPQDSSQAYHNLLAQEYTRPIEKTENEPLASQFLSMNSERPISSLKPVSSLHSGGKSEESDAAT